MRRPASDHGPHHQAREAVHAGVLLVAASAVTGVGNLAFNVVVARHAGAATYGELGPLLALATVAGFLANGTMYATARLAARSAVSAPQLFMRSLRACIPYLSLSVGLAIASAPVASFLHLRSPAPVGLAAVLVAAIVVGAASNGILIGRRRFRVLAAVTIASAVLRLGGALPLAHLAGPLLGSLVASIVPAVVTLAVTVPIALRSAPASGSLTDGATSGPRLTGGVRGGLLGAALWSVWIVPVVLGRHLLTPAATGHLVAGQTIASSVLYLASPIVTAFFPANAAAAQARTARLGLGLTAMIAAVAGLGLVVVGPIVFPLLFGSSYALSRPLLGSLAVSAATVACVSYSCWLAVARGHGLGWAVGWPVAALGLVLPLALMLGRVPVFLALSPACALLVTGLIGTSLVRWPAHHRMAPVSLVPTRVARDEVEIIGD